MTRTDPAERAKKAEQLAGCLKAVREKAPLIQAITNFVTVNDCANIILAAGASPTMAHDIREAGEIAAKADALVLNMGAVAEEEAMVAAGLAAARAGRPVVLDPVAAGASALRKKLSARLLKELKLTVIRGNSSEIRCLALGTAALAGGVDAAAADLVCEATLEETVRMAKAFAARQQAVVVISGAMDIVAEQNSAWILRGGSPTMARITGSGCMLTALIGAFLGANPRQPLLAALAAAGSMKLAGELAEARRQRLGTGTASFRTYLIDAVSTLTPDQLKGGIRLEQY